MGKPAGNGTCGSELLVITGLHRSGFIFWELQVLVRLRYFYFLLILLLSIILHVLMFECLIKCSRTNSPTASETSHITIHQNK
jgi:hypothetical protein